MVMTQFSKKNIILYYFILFYKIDNFGNMKHILFFKKKNNY